MRRRGAAPARWISVGVLAEVWRRFRRGWGALPAAARRRWGWAFGAGFVAAQAVCVAAVWVGRAFVEPALGGRERAAIEALDGLRWPSFTMAMWLEPLGSAFVLWPLMAAAAGFAAWRGRPLHALSLLLGYGSVFLHVLTGWLLWNRPRPTLIADGLGSPGALHSFPSGHVAQAVFTYGILAYLWCAASRSRSERILVAALAAAVVAVVTLGRLRLGAHWPSDVVAAVAVAGVWTVAVAIALRRAAR